MLRNITNSPTRNPDLRKNKLLSHFFLHIFMFCGDDERFVSRLTKSPIQQQDPTVPLISVENLVKSVENPELACGNAVESLGKTQAKNKNCKGESIDFRFLIGELTLRMNPGLQVRSHSSIVLAAATIIATRVFDRGKILFASGRSGADRS